MKIQEAASNLSIRLTQLGADPEAALRFPLHALPRKMLGDLAKGQAWIMAERRRGISAIAMTSQGFECNVPIELLAVTIYMGKGMSDPVAEFHHITRVDKT